MLQLSRRLTAVAALVTEPGTLADVGTDHGYIPVYLAGQQKIKRAVAMDVKEGPLNRAKIHIRQYGLEQVIETRLSDGLSALCPGEVDSIVIAGMGGALMCRILSEGESTAKKARELVLQPQSEVYAFRRFLGDQGYRIKAEDMVLEDGKYYPMMRACPIREEKDATAEKESKTLRLEQKYGPILLRQRHPVLYSYLRKQEEQKKLILEKIASNAREDTAQRRVELEEELLDLSMALRFWEEE